MNNTNLEFLESEEVSNVRPSMAASFEDGAKLDIQTMRPESTTPTLNNITAEQLTQIIVDAIRSIKVYVLESDITEAQQSVRTVVERSSF